MVEIVRPWIRTAHRNIAICPTCRVVIKPKLNARFNMARYRHFHEIFIIDLIEGPAGERDIYIPGPIDRRFVEAIKNLWIEKCWQYQTLIDFITFALSRNPDFEQALRYLEKFY